MRLRFRIATLIMAILSCAVIAAGAMWSRTLQFELGYAFESGSFHGCGCGLSRDHGKAAFWLGKAAAGGHRRAQYLLGILYAHGWGVTRDNAQSVRWLTRAADGGYGPALYHLGWMYHKGDGVPRDGALSATLLERAAAQGMSAASLALGGFLEHGDGQTSDLIGALKWYIVADYFGSTHPALFSGKSSTRVVTVVNRNRRLANRVGLRLSRDGPARSREMAQPSGDTFGPELPSPAVTLFGVRLRPEVRKEVSKRRERQRERDRASGRFR